MTDYKLKKVHFVQRLLQPCRDIYVIRIETDKLISFFVISKKLFYSEFFYYFTERFVMGHMKIHDNI